MDNDPDITLRITFVPLGESHDAGVAFAYTAVVHDWQGDVNPSWGRSGWIVWEGMRISTNNQRDDMKLVSLITVNSFNNKVIQPYRKAANTKKK